MYLDIFNLISNALYGAVVLTGWQELFVTTVASTFCLFAFCVPFILVWKVICIIVGR